MYLHAPTYGHKGWRGGCGRAMGVSHKTLAGRTLEQEMIPFRDGFKSWSKQW